MKNNLKKQNKKTNIFVYFIKMCCLFLLVNFFISLFPSFLTDLVTHVKYGQEFIVECFCALFILIVMLLSKNRYVFTEKREKFFKSLILAIPLLIISILNLITRIVEIDNFDVFSMTNILLLCFSIGVTEEFLCRGWLQNEFIERYSENRKQVILSIFLSSLIFGFFHLGNLLAGQTLFETILQVIQTIGLGFFLGSIYYRTKNIWTVIFLHAFYDFSVMISEVGVLKSCTYSANPSTEITFYLTISSIILVVIYFISSAILLRKSKFEDSKKFDEKELKKDEKVKNILIAMLVLLFMVTFIPYNIKGWDEYETCYKFNEYKIDYEKWLNTESHFPKYEDYTIKYLKENKTDNFIEEESITNQEIELKIYLDNYLLTIENVNTKRKVILDYEYINDFEVLENYDKYIIVIHDINDDGDSVIYYSDFISKENLTNSDNYLNEIKKSFTKYDVPNLKQIGYLTSRNDSYKYPYFITDNNNDKMIIKQDKKLYLLKLN